MIKVPDLLTTNNAIFVYCNNRNFIVQNLQTLEKVEIKPIQLYSKDFLQRELIEEYFLTLFPGKIFIFIREQTENVIEAVVDFNKKHFGTV